MQKKSIYISLVLLACYIHPALGAKLDIKPYEDALAERCLQKLPEDKRSDKESRRECVYRAIMAVSGQNEMFDQALKKAVKRECRKAAEDVDKCVIEEKRKYFNRAFGTQL